jgi:hypothetical protein
LKTVYKQKHWEFILLEPLFPVQYFVQKNDIQNLGTQSR